MGKIVKKVEEVVATVEPYPGEIAINVNVEVLTEDEARQLAVLLMDAIEDSQHLYWDDDSDEVLMLDDRRTPRD